MTRRFEGWRVLVTGASRGLGRDIALRFASEGALVGIGYRSRSAEAAETLAQVRSVGGAGELIQLDMRDATSVATAVEGFATGGLDVLVNNAAVVRDQLFPMLAEEEWTDVMHANLDGTFRCSRAAVPFLLRRKKGAIINVGSIAGMRASPGQANYAAAKGGILSLTMTMAAELAPRGIRVNAVVPGLLSTGMGSRLDHRVAEIRRTAIPLGRFGGGGEVAGAVAFLASDDASYVVGQSLVVDGGLSL